MAEQVFGGEHQSLRPARETSTAMLRGFLGKCPNCGEGRLFARFTTVVNHCERCGEDLSHQRADDAPPYFVIVIVGHIVVALALMVERTYAPPLWLHMLLWLPLATILVYAFNPSNIQSWPISGLTFHWFHVAWHDADTGNVVPGMTVFGTGAALTGGALAVGRYVIRRRPGATERPTKS